MRKKVILGLIGSLSLIVSFILIGGPYYYWLGQEHYIPKSNPNAGFVLPQTPMAWAFFISGVIFLGVSIVAFVRFRQTEPTIKHVI